MQMRIIELGSRSQEDARAGSCAALQCLDGERVVRLVVVILGEGEHFVRVFDRLLGRRESDRTGVVSSSCTSSMLAQFTRPWRREG